jgi:hypothetical protein
MIWVLRGLRTCRPHNFSVWNKYELGHLKAHFDGTRICLDDPYPLKPNTQLLVTVVSNDAERQAWLAASQSSLTRAYADDEPDYSDAVLREKPPGK